MYVREVDVRMEVTVESGAQDAGSRVTTFSRACEILQANFGVLADPLDRSTDGQVSQPERVLKKARTLPQMPPQVGSLLKGKVCIVTGSSKGIGKEIAIHFAQEGAKVVVNYRSDPAGADAAIAECEKAGGPGCAVKIHADLGKLADCQGLVEQAYKHFGAIDVLVNNAGMETHSDFWDVTEKDYDRVMNVNMKGCFFCAQTFCRLLKAQGKPGTIVNISSVHEDLPFPGFAPYCMSKGGMKMMTRNLSIELAPDGITINNIAPGAIATSINASVLKEPEKLKALLENIPLQRLGNCRDVSNCAVFLASDEASYITGTTIVVDGGLTWNYVENH